MPFWMAPLGAGAFVLGALGLFFSVSRLLRLLDPAENAFEFAVAVAVFSFVLTRPGRYELALTRPGQYNRLFRVPPAELTLRALPNGPAQPLPTGGGGSFRSTDLGGATTVGLATFAVAAPGPYELLLPADAPFAPTDRLRIRPAAGVLRGLLVLGIVGSGVLLVGGLIGGLIGLGGAQP